MPISNGSIILAADVNGIWQTALATLRARTTANNPNKQFTETFSINGIVASTPEYLRTIVYVPRTDVILRSARVYIVSTNGGVLQNGISATVTIPAQLIEDNSIVGGNIPRTLTATATSNASANLGSSAARLDLPNDQLFTFLAGDNIDIVVSTADTANVNKVIVSLTLESVLTG
jgi:hypothetical protein